MKTTEWLLTEDIQLMDSCSSSPIDLQSLCPLVDTFLSVYKMIFRAALYLTNERDETKPLSELSWTRTEIISKHTQVTLHINVTSLRFVFHLIREKRMGLKIVRFSPVLFVSTPRVCTYKFSLTSVCKHYRKKSDGKEGKSIAMCTNKLTNLCKNLHNRCCIVLGFPNVDWNTFELIGLTVLCVILKHFHWKMAVL